MLNRNDRKSLRRNRSAVSWLCVLSIILIVWIRNLYSDMSFAKEDYNDVVRELSEKQKEIDRGNNKIDSLTKIINYKDTSVEVKKPYIPTVRKEIIDTTVKIVKKDTLLKDSIK
jgi:peptidoglycan hydrolase CwlO-like protein